MNTNTHLESIADFANDIEAMILEFDPSGFDEKQLEWANDLLEIAIWKRTSDESSYRAELLIQCGGPTTWIEIDSRWSHATLHHSWGCDRSGEPLTKWTLRESVTEILTVLIETMID
jgi:hypothetical protein